MSNNSKTQYIRNLISVNPGMIQETLEGWTMFILIEKGDENMDSFFELTQGDLSKVWFTKEDGETPLDMYMHPNPGDELEAFMKGKQLIWISGVDEEDILRYLEAAGTEEAQAAKENILNKIKPAGSHIDMEEGVARLWVTFDKIEPEQKFYIYYGNPN